MSDDPISRRTLLGATAAAVLSGAAVAGAQQLQESQQGHQGMKMPMPATPKPPPDPASGRAADGPPRGLAPGVPGRDYTPVITPNGVTLPFRVVNGVKVFHLIAEVLEHEFAPGLKATCWGFNGRTIGPTIEAVEGDRVRIYVTNKLPEATSVHWHGVILPSGMDGVGGLSQAPIPPGATFRYEYTLRQHGTCMYHSHYDEMTQLAFGMMGMFVIHPRNADRRVDKDFVMLSSEWRVAPGTSRPDPLEMTDFNVLTFNSKAFPATAPLLIQRGDRVRIRFGNLSATDHHPIHVHGYAWHVVGTDGGDIPAAGQQPETTVLVPVGATRTVEFVANNPGDWAMHCHMSHHTMNQMGHRGGNWVGVKPAAIDDAVKGLLPDYMTMGTTGMAEMSEMAAMGGMTGMAHTGAPPRNSIPMLGGKGPFGNIDMGGMLTVLKVRDRVQGQADPGWYTHPKGTVAEAATEEELKRDGVGV